jgi:hypothetical protein
MGYNNGGVTININLSAEEFRHFKELSNYSCTPTIQEPIAVIMGDDFDKDVFNEMSAKVWKDLNDALGYKEINGFPQEDADARN